ncbi:hypothetical protein FGU71_10430 [Erythrobacter insulae]|uniref:Uncharacterized protein n=1 Tax=Erythrobacter insulae TaxID=2584124 RepID=A0A547PDM7_9SPHN|nr:hypothetical protein [Erythrobacter insulae]TRD12237.1 hypothetical protein FGU71_10430 [Erythrobacter insulae]
MLTETMMFAPVSTAQFETKSADAAPTHRARRYRPRRSTADRVREAVLKLTNGRSSLLSHEEKAWASITFSGTRHELMLDFDGKESAAAGENFIANLPEHEFHIPGQLVAEATIREVDHSFSGDDERMVVTAVLLLLEES